VRALTPQDLAALRAGARDRGLAAVVEAHGAVEIRQAAAVDPDVLGVNARDLTSFETDLSSLAAMGREIPPGPVRLGSGIRTRDGIAKWRRRASCLSPGEALLRAD
jgi:indole-3-glycerol phosphate synthase